MVQPPTIRTTREGMLIIHAITDRPIGEGSLVEVVLFDPWRGRQIRHPGGI